jgi:hypothetical protein
MMIITVMVACRQEEGIKKGGRKRIRGRKNIKDV